MVWLNELTKETIKWKKPRSLLVYAGYYKPGDNTEASSVIANAFLVS